MKIIGKGEPVRNDQNEVIDQTILVEMTETEARKVTGVDGKPQIAGRFRPGRELGISGVYDSVAKINEKQAELRASLVSIKAAAADMENSLILTDEA